MAAEAARRGARGGASAGPPARGFPRDDDQQRAGKDRRAGNADALPGAHSGDARRGDRAAPGKRRGTRGRGRQQLSAGPADARARAGDDHGAAAPPARAGKKPREREETPEEEEEDDAPGARADAAALCDARRGADLRADRTLEECCALPRDPRTPPATAPALGSLGAAQSAPSGGAPRREQTSGAAGEDENPARARTPAAASTLLDLDRPAKRASDRDRDRDSDSDRDSDRDPPSGPSYAAAAAYPAAAAFETRRRVPSSSAVERTLASSPSPPRTEDAETDSSSASSGPSSSSLGPAASARAWTRATTPPSFGARSSSPEESVRSDDDATETSPGGCLLYTSPSPRDATLSRMPSSA